MAAKPVGWGMIGTRGWSDMVLGPAVNAARGARFKAVLSTKQENAERYCASHGVARGYTDLEAFLADDCHRRGVDREPQPPAQGPDHRRAQGRQARALREAHGDEPGRVPGDDQGREEGRAPAHHRLQQPLPPEARCAPHTMAGRPLRRAGAHALPVPLPLSARARRLVAPRRRDSRAAGCWAISAPTSSTCCAGSTARRRRCTPTSPTRPTGAPPTPPPSPSASRTVPWAPSRPRPR